jgi:thiamine pyrophosphate-dependent acetolactate synthase large subunit-like protein
MRDLVKDIVNTKLSRRGFVSAMAVASYSASAAKSALAAVEPFIPGAELPEGWTRTVSGTGIDLLNEQIKETGTKYMFVANGSGLGPLCSAMVRSPGLQFIQATHEGQAVAIADGYAKVTHKPSFCMFSRVGLPHSCSNLYNAMKDRTPVITIADHAPSQTRGTDSHEDIDNWEEAVRFYTKWTWTAARADRLAEWVRRAYKVAGVMPGGPTNLRIPRDLMTEQVTGTVYTGQALNIPMVLRPNAQEVERVARILLASESPMMVVGPEVGQCGARTAVVELAELLAIPVIQYRSFYCDFPNNHDLWLGESDQLGAWVNAYGKPVDCWFNMGARTILQPYREGVPMIHASVNSETIGRNIPLAGALVGDLNEVAKDLIAAIKSLVSPEQLRQRSAERRAMCGSHTQRLLAARMEAGRLSGGSPVPWMRAIYELRQQLEPDAVVVEETGTQYRALGMLPFGDNAMEKIGRTEGRALGWGVGASAGVKLAMPNRQVISLQGDGGFLFGQTDALWTHSRYNIPVMTVVFNNRSYEETRWQMLRRGGQATDAGQAERDYVSYLGDPDVDFTALASAYNIPGAVVNNSDELSGAISRGLRTLAEGRPFMLDIRTRRLGIGAELSWYPGNFSVADLREREV